jgi:hypothetical protein
MNEREVLALLTRMYKRLHPDSAAAENIRNKPHLPPWAVTPRLLPAVL